MDRTEHGIPRAVAIAWGMHEVPHRGPSRGLSHERIVAAAVEIADSDGLAAVTMQRVAESLGFTTMSLYRYVASKDELLRLMQDAAGSLPKVEPWPPKEGWREGLRIWSAQLREVYRARPWVLEIPRTPQGILMPNSMAVADRGLAVLVDLAITDEQKIAVILNISLMVAAYVRLEQELETDEEMLFDEQALELLGEVITSERLPHIGPMTLAGDWFGSPPPEGEPDSRSVDMEYAFSLERFIEGLELLDARNRGEQA